jgi:excisionase family DNA binding protein
VGYGSPIRQVAGKASLKLRHATTEKGNVERSSGHELNQTPAVHEELKSAAPSRARELFGKVASMATRELGEPLLTVGEVATLMRVSNMTVYRLIKSGQLAAVRVGKNYRLRTRDIEHYLRRRAVRVEGD